MNTNTVDVERDAQRRQALRLLLEARSVAVLAHVNPDGDALGSALGLALGLRQIGKRAEAVCADELPENLSFLPGYREVRTDGSLPADLDLFILLDSSDLRRFGRAYVDNVARFRGARTINIDHHTTNRAFGDVNIVDTQAAATAELVYELLNEANVRLDPAIATCLLTALVTDTRAFRTPSTTPRTLAYAAVLLGLGAPLHHIVEAVYRHRSLSTLRLWGMALARLQVSDGFAWTEITVEMQQAAGASATEGDGVVDLMSSLADVGAVVLFKEVEDGVKISLRSNDGVDVAQVATAFGGGGHPRAAGCSVPGPLVVAKRQVLEYLARHVASH